MSAGEKEQVAKNRERVLTRQRNKRQRTRKTYSAGKKSKGRDTKRPRRFDITVFIILPLITVVVIIIIITLV